MTAQTQSNGSDLARARTMRMIAIVIAIVAFGALVVGFGMSWSPYYQVPAGLIAYAAVEWQRHCGKKIKELSAG